MTAGTLTTIVGWIIAVTASCIIPVVIVKLQQRSQAATDAREEADKADEDRNVSWRSMNKALQDRNVMLQKRLDSIDEHYQKLIKEARDECDERNSRLQKRVTELESEVGYLRKLLRDGDK